MEEKKENFCRNLQRARTESRKNFMVYRRHNLCGARRHRDSAADIANHAFSLGCRGLLLQKLREDAQVASEQQMVRRVHTQLSRRQGTDEKNQNHRFIRVMGNNRHLNGFLFTPPFASDTCSATAVNHDSSSDSGKRISFKATNFQKEMIFRVNYF